MKIKGILMFVFILFILFSTTIIAKEQTKKIKPAPGKTEDTKKEKKSIKPASSKVEDIKFEELSKIITEVTGKYQQRYKEILKEEIKPRTEFETEEEYKKRLEGASFELNKKKIQIMEEIYKKKVYYSVKEVAVELPQYNAEEQFFDIKLLTLPTIENVIYQTPEEQTNLRFVPTENGVDLMLKLKISPKEGKNLRENEKLLRENLTFTIYLSLKNDEDLNVYSVVAFSDVELYIKNKDSIKSVYRQSLRVNTPTFPKKN